MDHRTFDTFTRFVGSAVSRRGVLGGLAGGLLAGLPLAARHQDSLAKKKKKITICFEGETRKTKKKGWQGRFPGATKGACNLAQQCAETCGDNCSTCYERVSGALLCGGIASSFCKSPPCSSDDDCMGTIWPICTKSFTELATEETSKWDCAAACTNIAPCDKA
jgi:hypothetical protein